MRINFLRYFSFFSIFLLSVCGKDHCPSACQLALSSIVFPDVNANSGHYPIQCGSTLRVTSVYACIQYYCHSLSLEDGRSRLNGPCERYANITLPPVSIIDGLSNADFERLPHFGREDYDRNFEADEIVMPDEEVFGLALRSKDAWSHSVKVRTQYGHAMFYFWLAVVIVGFAYRFSSWQSSGHIYQGRLWVAVKRWLLVPATLSTRCAEPYGWCIVPTRLQTIILLTFTIINVILCCVSYDVFQGNLNWSESVQWSRYIADRTGAISIANLPLIWLFATRNNLLVVITGWSFETAMQFHRWVARISTIEAVVHSIAYTVIVFQTGDWMEYVAYWQIRWWAMGGLATVAMSLICVFSIYPMRHYYYEPFLIIHMSLGSLTLLGMWYHVEIFDGTYNWYIWPCVLIWLLDRVARILRLVCVNYSLNLSTLEYDPKSNGVWLTIPTTLKQRPQPGEYYFLYLFKDYSFYESHPFTLSSWDKSGLRFLIRPYNGFTERLARIGQLAYSTTGKSKMSCKVRVLAEGPYGATSDLRLFDSIVFVVGGTGVAVALAYLTDFCEDIARGMNSYRTGNFKIIWAVQHHAFFRQVYEREIEPKLQLLCSSLEARNVHINLDVYVTRGYTAPQPDRNSLDIGVLPKILLPAKGDPGKHHHELALFDVSQFENESEETTSERSSLLSSRTRSPTLEESDPRPRKSDASLPESDGFSNYHIPSNTTLNLYLQTRPDISTLVLEACSPSPISNSALHADNDANATDRLLEPGKEADDRIVIVCCGPSSLADATRAAVVKALSLQGTDRIEFINESYSW